MKEEFTENSLPISQEKDIDRTCDAFEAAWKAGQNPRIEDYLRKIASASQEQAFRQLLATELRLRQAGGHSTDADDYRRRFPRYSGLLDELIQAAGTTTVELSLESTGNEPHPATPGPPAIDRLDEDAEPVPKRIGQFIIEGVLGKGGFGHVYRARDPQLHRRVAIKGPSPAYWNALKKELKERFQEQGATRIVSEFLEEARKAAGLKHSGLVAVHEFRVEDGRPYIVQELIEGCDLAHWASQNSTDDRQIAALMLEVAEALSYAHQQGFVHRDLKPANVLIDPEGHPHVADFGLALHESVQLGRAGEFSGTLPYMSPEQVRREAHRLDGRSDLWSWGVMFYELLANCRPFEGNTVQLIAQIESGDPRPPRQRRPNLPAELGRICMKCLEKQRSDRYASAADLIDDLKHWLQDETRADRHTSVSVNAAEQPSHQQRQVPIDAGQGLVIPKGLRSFDEHDADFFLELIPGPRGRDGLPESIRFWKTRIEETDPDKTFSVGLIFGPSGCGKSSLVKAGLLPRLRDRITSVCIEATPDDTEVRLLKALRKLAPDLQHQSLPATLLQIRSRGVGPNQKLLVVLDQFEQWLQSHGAEQEPELVVALRQCDGANLQCVVSVRDDFSMPCYRFFDALDIELRQAENFATVDTFDVRHAEKVLRLFGQSYGAIGDGDRENHDAFVTQAVSELADEKKRVICVQLALFSDMVKGKPWAPATLTEVGGAQGIGVAFLEETLGGQKVNPRHYRQREAARAVLKSLLPASSGHLKGYMQSHQQLQEAAGYMASPRDFADLLAILDGELRLITPTDPDDGALTQASSLEQPREMYYQLTHDYLVHSLREWLTGKQRETRRGRAELRLAECAALWHNKADNRHLPSWSEYARIRFLTRPQTWSDQERRLMRRSGRFHGVRGLIVAFTFISIAFIGLQLQNYFVAAQDAVRVATFVKSLSTTQIESVPEVIEKLDANRDLADPMLREALAGSAPDSDQHLHASLALLPVDASQLDYLKERLVNGTPHQVSVLRDRMLEHANELQAPLWELLHHTHSSNVGPTLATAAALARFTPADQRWESVAGTVAHALVSCNVVELATWMELLKPVRRHLIPALTDIFRDAGATHTDSQQDLATSVLAEYTDDQLNTLVELIKHAQVDQLSVLLPHLEQHRDAAVTLLNTELDRVLEPQWADPIRDPGWIDVAPSLVTQFEASGGLLKDRFAFCQTMPLRQFVKVVEELRRSGYRPLRVRPYHVVAEVDGESDVLVAAVWTRDDRDWKVVQDADSDAVRQADSDFRASGFIPVDVCGYLAVKDGKLLENYAGVWVQRANADDDARLYAGVLAENQAAADAQLAASQLEHAQSAQAFRGHDGRLRYSAIKSTLGDHHALMWDMVPRQFEIREYLDMVQWDIDLGLAPQTLSTRDRLTQQVQAADKQLKAAPDQQNARWLRAVANYYLENDERALEDLEFLLEKDRTKYNGGLRLRAWIHARNGRKEDAMRDLGVYLQSGASSIYKQLTRAVTLAHFDGSMDIMRPLESTLQQQADDAELLRTAAKTYSLAAKASVNDAERAAAYTERAVNLLEQAIDNGLSESFTSLFDGDPDFDAIRESPELQALLKRWRSNRRFNAVWQISPGFRSHTVHGSSPEKHLEQCQDLIEEGFRPVAITASSQGAELLTASVWHQPVVSSEAQEELAFQQANAAAALMYLSETDRIYPLLKHISDPTLRSWLIQRLPFVGDINAVWNRINSEPDEGIRRALILGLGEFDDVQAFAEDPEKMDVFLDLYRNAPDPGIHGAARWVLTRCGMRDRVNEIDQALATGKAEGDRRWYVTTKGNTMTLLGPAKFLMGSHPTDRGRRRYENLHRRRIDRTFAIANHEVTVKQFRAFQEEHPDVLRGVPVKRYSPDDECPMIYVDWLSAAKYCRWLSEQEGIAEDQMCFPPIRQIVRGMRLPENFLNRTGYRLPTEGEWEYAGRAMTATRRFFGRSVTLLARYGWFSDNAEDRTWPVASLRPNDFGLFDMYGNTWEWCYDRSVGYRYGVAGQAQLDQDKTGLLFDNYERALRGGSNGYHKQSIRSAYRFWNYGMTGMGDYGFRVARTMPKEANE